MTVIDVELEDTEDHPSDEMTGGEEISRYGDFRALAGQTLKFNDAEVVVIAAEPADSNLPNRDGSPGFAKLINAYQLLVVLGGGVEETLYACRHCHMLDQRKGRIVHHARSCPQRPSAEAEAATSKRMYIPSDVRAMTIGQLIELHRNYTGQDPMIEKLRQDLVEERRRRHEAERGLAAIRKALGVAPASST